MFEEQVGSTKLIYLTPNIQENITKKSIPKLTQIKIDRDGQPGYVTLCEFEALGGNCMF